MKTISKWLLSLLIVGILPTGIFAGENIKKDDKLQETTEEKIKKAEQELKKLKKEQNKDINERWKNRQLWYNRFLNGTRVVGTAGFHAAGFSLMAAMANGWFQSVPDAELSWFREVAREANCSWADKLRVKQFPGDQYNAAAGFDFLHQDSPFAMIGTALWNDLTPDERRMIFLHECGHVEGNHLLEAQKFLALRALPLAMLSVSALPYVYRGSKWVLNKGVDGVSFCANKVTEKTKNFVLSLTPEFVKKFYKGFATKQKESQEQIAATVSSVTPGFVKSFIDWTSELKKDLGKEFKCDYYVKSCQYSMKNNSRMLGVIVGTKKPRTFVETGLNLAGSFVWGVVAFYVSKKVFNRSFLALGRQHEIAADMFALDHARGRGDVLACKNAFAKMLLYLTRELANLHSQDLWYKSQVEQDQFLRTKIEQIHKNDPHPTPWQRMELCDEYLKKYPVPNKN